MHSSLVGASLPVLDTSLERLKALANKSTTQHQHLAEIIRRDPGFHLALLREANRNLPTGRDPVQSVDHAISLMGVPRLLSFGDSLLPISTLPQASRQALAGLYSRAQHAANYFQALGTQARLPNVLENGRDTRLLALAEILLWTHQPDAIRDHAPCTDMMPVGDFKLHLDPEIRELATKLAASWSLPQTVQQAVAPDPTTQPLALAMTLADSLACTSANNWYSDYTSHLVELWSSITNMPVDNVNHTVHRLAAETAQQLTGRELPLPAFFLLMPAPPKPEESAEKSEEKPVAEQPERAAEKTPEPEPEPTKAEPSAATKPAAPEQQPATIKPATTTKVASTNPLQQVMTRHMKAMREQTGAERVMFAILTPDRKQLNVRFVLGGDASDPLRRFRTVLGGKDLFSLLMQKPQGAHINNENAAKFVPLIPQASRDMVKAENLFVMSVFVNQKPIGLFVADHRDAPLSASGYQAFKSLCQSAGQALEKLKSGTA